MEIIIVVLIIILIIVLIISILAVGIMAAIFSSAPWVPTPEKISKAMCQLADLEKGDKVLDLGCGDASILIVAARDYGAICHGIELSPIVATLAKIRVKLAGQSDKITIQRGNIFKVDYPDTDTVMLYMLPKATLKIENKLKQRYKNIKVVSHGFQLKTKPTKEKKIGKATVRLYKI